MRRTLSFRDQSIVSHALVVVLLAGGMAYAIRRLDALAIEQISMLREQEEGITVVERLRWSGEAIVAAGRGYLLSADPGLLTRLRRAEDDFDRGLLTLKRQHLEPRDASRVSAVETAASLFMERQRQLVADRQQDGESHTLVRRFERELRPLQVELGKALDVLVEQRERALDDVYRQGGTARARLSTWMHALLLVLVVLSAGASWYFARTLSRAFRKEHEAHEAARRAVEARDELMGVVAHDLRNPLGTIALRASLLSESGETDRTRAHADSIQRVTQRMQALITAMLDLATLEAGKLTVRPVPCEVDVLLDDACEIFDGIPSTRALRLERHATATAGVLVRADRDRIIQVFSNLVGNAAKFTPEGGLIELDAQQAGDVVRFSVANSGPGIAPEHLPHLFGRFWTREKNGSRGTGLGLFIAKGIVESHGGRIWAESEEGEGATFFFELPVTSRTLRAVPAELSGGQSTAG